MGWIASARHLAWQVGQGGVGGLVLGGDDQLLLYDGEYDQIMIEIMMILLFSYSRFILLIINNITSYSLRSGRHRYTIGSTIKICYGAKIVLYGSPQNWFSPRVAAALYSWSSDLRNFPHHPSSALPIRF